MPPKASNGAVSPMATCFHPGAPKPKPSLALAQVCAPCGQPRQASRFLDFPADEEELLSKTVGKWVKLLTRRGIACEVRATGRSS